MAKVRKDTDPIGTLALADFETTAMRTQAKYQLAERDGKRCLLPYVNYPDELTSRREAVEYDSLTDITTAALAGRQDQAGDEILSGGYIYKLADGGDPTDPNDWVPDVSRNRIFADAADQTARTSFTPRAGEQVEVGGRLYRVVDPNDASQDVPLSADGEIEDDTHGATFPTAAPTGHLHLLYDHAGGLANGQYIRDAVNDQWIQKLGNGTIEGTTPSTETGTSIISKIDATIGTDWKVDTSEEYRTQEFVVTAAHLAARTFVLSSNFKAGSVELSVRGAPIQDSPRDFIEVNPNGVSFAGRGLDGALVLGDVVDISWRADA